MLPQKGSSMRYRPMAPGAHNTVRPDHPIADQWTAIVRLCLVAVLVLAASLLNGLAGTGPAHAASPAQKASKSTTVAYDLDKLPEPVRNMIEQIVSAARSGRIAEMRTPYEWNELPPSLSDNPVKDPIAFWKKLSVDGEGREILAVLLNLLSSGYMRLPIGADAENPGLYVWPYFAEIQLKSLTPAQQVEALRLIPPQQFLAIRKSGRYTWWRLAIGADGTWHVFQKGP